MVATVASILGDASTCITSMVGHIGTVLSLFSDQPLLMVFIGVAFVGIAVRYGARLMMSAGKMA